MGNVARTGSFWVQIARVYAAYKLSQVGFPARSATFTMPYGTLPVHSRLVRSAS